MKIKFPLAKFFAMPFVLLAALLIAPDCHIVHAADVPLISVGGTGEVKAAPNEATVTLGVSTYAKDAGLAQKENAVKATAVQNALKELGLDNKAIRTQNYSFRPTYESRPNRERTVTGYAVDNSVVVTVDNLALIGKVIDAALNAGANQVNSLTFAAKNTDALKKTALADAVTDAKNKASVIADTLNLRIIGVQHISESVGMPMSRNYNMMFAAAKADNAPLAATPVEVPELTLTAQVQIDFILGK